MDPFVARSVIRRRPGGFTRNGDPLPAIDEVVPGCQLAPRTSSESTDLRDTVFVGLSMKAPPGSDVRSTDQIVVDAQVYQVEGEPGEGGRLGVLVALNRVEG